MIAAKRLSKMGFGLSLALPLTLSLMAQSTTADANELGIDFDVELGLSGFKRQGDTPINPDMAFVPSNANQSWAFINAQYNQFWQDIEVNLQPSLKLNYDFNGKQQPDYQRKYDSQVFWSNSYVKWHGLENHEFMLGRQNEEIGSGYAWNPSHPRFDIRLNERDSANKFRKSGDATAQWQRFDNHGYWQLQWSEHQSYPNNGQGEHDIWSLRRQLLLDKSEMTFTVAKVNGSAFAGFDFSWTVTDELEFHTELAHKEQSRVWHNSHLIYNDIDVIYYQQPSKDKYANALVGFQYTFEDLTNVIVEYFYQQDGYDQPQWQLLTDQIDYAQVLFEQQDHNSAAAAGFLANTHNYLRYLRRQYLFMRLSTPELIEDADSAFFSRVNLDDDSYILGASIDYNLNDNLDLGLSLQSNHGATYSESAWIPEKQRIDLVLKYTF